MNIISLSKCLSSFHSIPDWMKRASHQNACILSTYNIVGLWPQRDMKPRVIRYFYTVEPIRPSYTLRLNGKEAQTNLDKKQLSGMHIFLVQLVIIISSYARDMTIAGCKEENLVSENGMALINTPSGICKKRDKDQIVSRDARKYLMTILLLLCPMLLSAKKNNDNLQIFWGGKNREIPIKVRM